MPKKAKELSPVEVRRLARPGLHAVGGVAGLLLQVTESGARSWILRTTVGDRRRDIGLGGFPDVTLQQAREKAREAREQIRQGVDPIEQRKAARASLVAAGAKAITFDEAARKFLASKRLEFQNAKHTAQWESTLQTYASPIIGALPVDKIELAHVVQVLEPIWLEKTETASRLRGRIESVLAWATVSGFRQGDNPARWRGNLEVALPKPRKIAKVKHHRALPWMDVPAFMVELRKQSGLGAKALEFAIMTATRSGEVRGATWLEIDLPGKMWTIPAERMKAGKPHRVPLSAEARALLKALPRVEGSPYVFAAPRGGQLSDMTLSKVLRTMQVDAVPHGFRSSFKDWVRSSTRYPDEVSELALAHVNNDATRAAYARDELLPQRAKLMTEWARYLRGSGKQNA
ncbi:MAG: integrase arm-type DNA-binding domain-containing protein [Pseudomonadota bacterium]